MRHRFIAPLLALLAAATMSAVALAGGWAQVTVTEVPFEPTAESGTTIRLTVMQHAETAVSWPTLTVVATEAESGAVVRTDARPDGPVGGYIATITFPSRGSWTLSFESRDLIMEGGAVVAVGPSLVAAAPTSASTAATTGDATPVAFAIAVGIALLAFAGQVIRGRRAAGREVAASARG